MVLYYDHKGPAIAAGLIGLSPLIVTGGHSCLSHLANAQVFYTYWTLEASRWEPSNDGHASKNRHTPAVWGKQNARWSDDHRA